MDGDYPEQIQFVDPELEPFTDEEDEYEQRQYRTEPTKAFDNVDHQIHDDDVSVLNKSSVDHLPSRDFSAGKLFVGGVSWETSQETFSNYFSKYGAITDSIIMMDKQTGRPRGFGFVTFIDSGVVDKVLEKQHVIDGRPVEVKRTLPREQISVNQVKGDLTTKKIFVGGIPPFVTEDEFKDHFSAYGSILEHQIMFDHQTGRSRGFGFVTFESEDTVEMIFSEGKPHELGGKQVEIKKAEPKRGFTDHNSSSRSFGGPSAASNGGGYSSIGGYVGEKDNGYGGYRTSGGLGNYGGSYGGGSAAFYGGFGGYGYGYGFGGPLYGNPGYGNPATFGYPGGYAAVAGYGAGKGYGSVGAGAAYGAAVGGYSNGSRSSGSGYSNGGARAGGGYRGNGSGSGGYGGRGSGGSDDAGAATETSRRYHPYQR